jgi:hypothetical protein
MSRAASITHAPEMHPSHTTSAVANLTATAVERYGVLPHPRDEFRGPGATEAHT